MITTPICDFVQAYIKQKTVRGHMPGHGGQPLLGMEPWDITEVAGADSLYEAEGIIKQSEENASALFGCPTCYSAEGSSQCIKAMVYLALQWAKLQGKQPLIAAGRNAHRAFAAAAALTDAKVAWLYPREGESYLSCCPSAEDVETLLLREQPAALYLTSPDYLGHMADIASIARVCKKYRVLLMVDNAHGAYLRFLQPSLHPMDLGADICCDSAHKTLPVVTGGAYLHLSREMEQAFPLPQVKKAMALFGSTSPSYLILQSLDAANPLLATSFRERLAQTVAGRKRLGQHLEAAGYALAGDECIKITIQTKPYGYTGVEMAQCLRQQGVECEFCDPDYLVLMPGVMMAAEDEERLAQALLSLPKKPPLPETPPAFSRLERAMSIREAVMSPSEILPVEESEGRILADVSVGCPPAVPILFSGEKIDKNAMHCFRYYGITHLDVVK